MTRGRALSLCALLLGLPTSFAKAAGDDAPAPQAPTTHRVRTGLGFHYSVGDYGASSPTSIVYTPLTVRAEVGRWTLWGVLPYIRINGPGGFVQGPDGPVETTGGVSDGLGDIVARGSYYLPSDTAWVPSLEPLVVVKFPTASRDKGLGTGEFDFGIELGLTWQIQGLMPFAVAGYRFLGSAPGIPLDDVFEGVLGAQYTVAADTNVGFLMDYREAASEQSGSRLDAVPFASFRVRSRWAIDLYASAGLADGSPDAGVGFQIAYIL